MYFKFKRIKNKHFRIRDNEKEKKIEIERLKLNFKNFSSTKTYFILYM